MNQPYSRARQQLAELAKACGVPYEEDLGGGWAVAGLGGARVVHLVT